MSKSINTIINRTISQKIKPMKRPLVKLPVEELLFFIDIFPNRKSPSILRTASNV